VISDMLVRQRQTAATILEKYRSGRFSHQSSEGAAPMRDDTDRVMRDLEKTIARIDRVLSKWKKDGLS